MTLSDLAGLSEPATALVNRVSDAIGGIAKPWQTKRVAKAEAEAKKIIALGDLEITEFRERAIKRMVLEEERNQENIEAVTAKAIPHLSALGKPEVLEEDFLRYFFDKAKLVSNEEMQTVWGKILAGEANKAGSFSRRTLDIVSQMRKQDAELFTRLCRNIWLIEELVPIIPEAGSEEVTDFSLRFVELQHLDDMGLININSTEFQQTELPNGLKAKYYLCPVELNFFEEANTLDIGSVILTAAGRELFPIAGSTSSIPAFERGLEFFISQGVHVSIPIDAKQAYLDLA